MEETFDLFCYIFENIAYILSVDYKVVCVWIFGIIWPSITILLIIKAFANKTKRIYIKNKM